MWIYVSIHCCYVEVEINNWWLNKRAQQDEVIKVAPVHVSLKID